MVGFRGWTPWEVGSLTLGPSTDAPRLASQFSSAQSSLGDGAPPTQEPRPGGGHSLQGREYRRKTLATLLGLSLQGTPGPGWTDDHSNTANAEL